jgi:hypothetical protein
VIPIVSVTFVAAMPSSYPSSEPLLVHISPLKGLSSDQIDELIGLCQNVAVENVGMPSVFIVAMAVQEWLSENNIPGNDGSMYSGNNYFFQFTAANNSYSKFSDGTKRTEESC